MKIKQLDASQIRALDEFEVIDSTITIKEMADLRSDPNFERFGSSEFSCCFVDEVSEISQRAIEVMSSRLRWKVHEYGTKGRMLMSTNPTINWVRDRFVMDKDGNPPELKPFEAYINPIASDPPDTVDMKSTSSSNLSSLSLASAPR